MLVFLLTQADNGSTMGWLGRLLWVVLAIVFAWPVHAYADASQAGCGLCIVEVQTRGLSSATEEYVVIQNRTTSDFDLTGIIIKYFTAAGTPNTKTINLSGLLAPQAELAFVSDSLKTANPPLNGLPSGLAFADTGGTLQLLKGTVILDQVGWGTAVLSESAAIPTHNAGYSLVRQNSIVTTDDTGFNSVDFTSQPHACFGLSINEIQPKTIGLNGEDVTPFVELLRAINANTDEDCPLIINGGSYAVAAGDLASATLIAVGEVLNAADQPVALPLNPDTANTLQFMPVSLFGAIDLPGTTTSQAALLSGQSLARFGTSLKATYSPTPGLANVFSATPPNASGEATNNPTACEGVIMTELLPNAVGEDSGNEWIELYNQSGDTIFLGDCKILINSTEYSFNPDQFLDPGEYQHFTDFVDGTSVKTLTLKNTDLNTASFGRKFSGGDFEPLQTIQYENAPEGQSWARFNDGWHWSPIPTPSEANQLNGQGAADLPVTEFPANITPTSTGGDQELPALSVIQITELLPNPASPGTDENDEYVELYNTSNQAVNLTGYKVQTGNNYNYSYTLTDQTIAPNGYLILTSGGTSLTLSNSGGRARLLDPEGAVVSETDSYTEAEEGNAWTYLNGVWQWSSQPTPAATNVVITPVVVASKTKKASVKTTKAKTSTKKAATAKAAKAKATKAKTASAAGDLEEVEQARKLHPGVIAGVGLLAVGYAAYEYRRDIANRYYQLKRNRGSGKTSGK